MGWQIYLGGNIYHLFGGSLSSLHSPSSTTFATLHYLPPYNPLYIAASLLSATGSLFFYLLALSNQKASLYNKPNPRKASLNKTK